MSVALATMDSMYGLSRLGMTSHLHHLHRKRAHSPDEHVAEHLLHHHHHRRRTEEQPESASPLRFSVVNILRPDFGREAILNTRASPKTTPIKVTPLPVHSPVGVPRDLSLSAARLAAQSPTGSAAGSFSSHCGLTSPVQRPTSNLSRSGSLESLASNRSSVTGGSVTGSASIASSAGSAESVSGESTASGASSSLLSQSGSSSSSSSSNQSLWPAWIYCTRYSDRPSSGPRTRRVKRASGEKPAAPEEKRPRTAFSPEQLAKLKDEFAANRYLNETRRQKLSKELGLNEQQIKIWFQNKRAKIKKASGQKNPLALQLMAQGLYNHSTVPVDEDGEEIPPGQE